MILCSEKYGGVKGLHKFISQNKERIVYTKKSAIKHADSFVYYMHKEGSSVELFDAIKSNSRIENPPDILSVKVAINTTNIYDSHADVHIDGLWTKTLKENKLIAHIQEHKNGLEYVISDGNDLVATAKNFTFKELGFNYDGNTQALVFESEIRKTRNEFMHNQYANGWVNQHSVGMSYVKLVACVDNKDYPEEFNAWKKYIDKVANRNDIVDGYFFAVTEAKAIEGSAVTRGSNQVTPTIANNNSEPNKFHSDSQEEPRKSTLIKTKLYHLM